MKSRFNDPITSFMVNNTAIPSGLLIFEIYTRIFYDSNMLLSLILYSVIFLYYIICFISIKIPSKEEREKIKKDKNRKSAENIASKWTLFPLLLIMAICLSVFPFIGQKFTGMVLMCLLVFSTILFSILNAVFLHKNKKDENSRETERDSSLRSE